ncbi:hypothetical protein GJ496_009390 [Pomphorhynchus laevis]|nr:hypothetical protein GJ496_009390 [Pomphorhynchus laevis]
MTCASFQFEQSKQLFSYQRGEFLRVLYNTDAIDGYLGRSTASLIISPLQSNELMSKANVVKELYAQIAVLIRRGLPI